MHTHARTHTDTHTVKHNPICSNEGCILKMIFFHWAIIGDHMAIIRIQLLYRIACAIRMLDYFLSKWVKNLILRVRHIKYCICYLNIIIANPPIVNEIVYDEHVNCDPIPKWYTLIWYLMVDIWLYSKRVHWQNPLETPVLEKNALIE